MKVLLVDDDSDLLDLMHYALRREGYNVTTAADGQQALARWRAGEPAIVLRGGGGRRGPGPPTGRRRLRDQAVQRQATRRPHAGGAAPRPARPLPPAQQR